MTLIKGLGNCSLRTTDITGGPSAQKLFPYPVFDFEFKQESEIKTTQVYRGGKRVEDESFEALLKGTLTLKTQLSNWQMLGLSLGQLERSVTSLVIPKQKRVTVPTTAPYTITDTDITSGTAASVLVAVERYGTWGQAGPLARGTTTPTTGQVVVDGTGGTLTFNAAQAGAPIMYVVDQTFATAKAYGGAGTLNTLGDLEFFGEVYDNSTTDYDGAIIWLPRLQRASRPTIQFNGDIVELSTELKCLTPSGWDEPYMIIDGHSTT